VKGKSYILTEGTFGKGNTFIMFVSDTKNLYNYYVKKMDLNIIKVLINI